MKGESGDGRPGPLAVFANAEASSDGSVKSAWTSGHNPSTPIRRQDLHIWGFQVSILPETQVKSS